MKELEVIEKINMKEFNTNREKVYKLLDKGRTLIVTVDNKPMMEIRKPKG